MEGESWEGGRTKGERGDGGLRVRGRGEGERKEGRLRMRGRGEGERKEGRGREEGDLHADANTPLILLKFPNILFFSPPSLLDHTSPTASMSSLLLGTRKTSKNSILSTLRVSSKC